MRVGLEAMLQALEHPCRIEAALFTHPADSGLLWRRSYLKSLRPPLSHIEYCFGQHFDKLPSVPAPRSEDYNTCLQWPNGFPDGAEQLIRMLRRVLVLPAHDQSIDLALALDWYKIVDPNVASTEWKNTDVGQLVNKAKYWTSSPPTRRAAANQLIEELARAIEEHPALCGASALVSVPGSKGDGVSVGEYIAAGVAQRTGKVLMRTVGPPREPRKSGSAAGVLDGLFTMPSQLAGSCIVVDDVYRSGATMRATALAARKAGASTVFCLAAAKTISG